MPHRIVNSPVANTRLPRLVFALIKKALCMQIQPNVNSTRFGQAATTVSARTSERIFRVPTSLLQDRIPDKKLCFPKSVEIPFEVLQGELLDELRSVMAFLGGRISYIRLIGNGKTRPTILTYSTENPHGDTVGISARAAGRILQCLNRERRKQKNLSKPFQKT
jgi:hypothetical protein